MPHGKDYIPKKDRDFDLFFKKVVQYTAAKCAGPSPAWTHIPPAALAELTTAYTAWYAAYGKILGEHTSEDTREKQRVRKLKEPVLREFIQRYLKYDPVTDYDRDEMSIPNPDKTRSPIGRPEDHVRLFIEPNHIREHKIIWEVEETGKRAVPYGCDGVVLVKRILEYGEPVPADPGELDAGRLLSKNYIIEEFTPADQNKRCVYAACLQNNRGEKGPWSDITVVGIA